MKDTLEYKILRHLKDNDNGDFIVMKGFIEDEVKLTNKLLSLSKTPEKYISFSGPVTIFGGSSPPKTFGTIAAKIEFNGIKYLNEIEKEDKIKTINNSGVYIEANDNKGTQSFDDIETKNKVNTNPKIKPEQKSLVKKIFSNPWTLLFVGILIEELTLGKIWEYIFGLFE